MSGNNFTGSVPFDLVERSTNGSLKLRYFGFSRASYVTVFVLHYIKTKKIKPRDQYIFSYLCHSVSGNQHLCSLDCEDYSSNSNSTKKKKNQFIIPVIASIAAFLVILIAVVIVWKVMKRKTGKFLVRSFDHVPISKYIRIKINIIII